MQLAELATLEGDEDTDVAENANEGIGMAGLLSALSGFENE